MKDVRATSFPTEPSTLKYEHTGYSAYKQEILIFRNFVRNFCPPASGGSGDPADQNQCGSGSRNTR
jgi:hypothetical protein